jgi:hypothetical protein
MNSGFHWVISPQQQLIPNLEAYGKKALVAVQAVANYWGQMIQDAARTEARWVDRTGNARGGLFFAVDGFGLGTITGTVTSENTEMSDVTIESGDKDTLIITLGHTMFYGKFLELSNGGNNAIIMSTIESNLPALDRMMKDTFA